MRAKARGFSGRNLSRRSFSGRSDTFVISTKQRPAVISTKQRPSVISAKQRVERSACLAQVDVQISRLRHSGSARNDKKPCSARNDKKECFARNDKIEEIKGKIGRRVGFIPAKSGRHCSLHFPAFGSSFPHFLKLSTANKGK